MVVELGFGFGFGGMDGLDGLDGLGGLGWEAGLLGCHQRKQEKLYY